jgi:hypothetical protein
MNASSLSTMADAQDAANHLRKMVYNQEYFLVKMFESKLSEMNVHAINGKTEFYLKQVDDDRYKKIVAYLKEKPFHGQVGRFEVRDQQIPHYKTGPGDEETNELEYIQHCYELWFVLN